MKIYEIRNYIDGGANDRGYIKGYVQGEDIIDARNKANIKDNFTLVEQISLGTYLGRKSSLELQLKMYNLDI